EYRGRPDRRESNRCEGSPGAPRGPPAGHARSVGSSGDPVVRGARAARDLPDDRAHPLSGPPVRRFRDRRRRQGRMGSEPRAAATGGERSPLRDRAPCRAGPDHRERPARWGCARARRDRRRTWDRPRRQRRGTRNLQHPGPAREAVRNRGTPGARARVRWTRNDGDGDSAISNRGPVPVTPLRVLVADDEPVARRGLRKLLAAEPDVEVVGEAGDGREAVAAIRRLKPDLVLLDVQMPELDGIGVVRELAPSELPEVVFVTAYDRYAIAAFDLQAVDYVLKPVQAKRFSLALSRARRRLESARPGDLAERIERLLGEYGRAGSTPDRILVRSGSKALFVKLDDIEWLEASGNYVRLHTPARDPRTLVRETLAHLAEWLPPKFLRV